MEGIKLECLLIAIATLFTIPCLAQEDVRMPPIITKSPKREVVFKAGDEIDMKCIADGLPEPTYVWYKDGALLEIRDRISQRPPGSGNIVIAQANAYQDNGVYQCQASNKYGIALSNKITVKQAAIIYTSRTDPLSKTVTVGDSLVLEPFDKIESFPEPVYNWKTVIDPNTNEDQKPLVPSSRISINPANGKLFFAYVTPADTQSGRIYKLDVQNAIEDLTRGGSPYVINVIDGPLSNKRPSLLTPRTEDYTVVGIKGKNATLKCFFGGYPTPRVSWIQPPDPPPQSRIDCTQQYSTECLIRNLEYSDQGLYRCQGNNEAGSHEARITLQIESIPSFKILPQSKNVTEGQSAVFKCEPDARPEADITWFSDGKYIDPSNPGSSKLVISDDMKTLTVHNVCKNCGGVTKSDLQVFQCQIKNKHGEAYISAYLNVIEATTIYYTSKQEIELEYDGHMEVNFTCNVKTDPLTKKQLEVAWWHRDARIYNNHGRYKLENKDQSLFINMTGLTDDERKDYVGTYECRAYTFYSNASAVFMLKIKGIVVPVDKITIADVWWVILLILLILLLILLCCVCCICYKLNKGDAYPVDEKEKKNGNDPEAELKDMDFHEHHRDMGFQEEWKGSKASLLPAGSTHSLNMI